MNASDVIAIVAIIAGIVGTLIAGFLGDWRASRRAKAERILQARLRAIEDTQRYVMATMEHIQSLGLVAGYHGPSPNLADYPKVTLALISEPGLMSDFGDYIFISAKRFRAGGPPWTAVDTEYNTALGILLSRNLRDQEERVLAGQEPLEVPMDQQEADMAALAARHRATGGEPPA